MQHALCQLLNTCFRAERLAEFHSECKRCSFSTLSQPHNLGLDRDCVAVDAVRSCVAYAHLFLALLQSFIDICCSLKVARNCW